MTSQCGEIARDSRMEIEVNSSSLPGHAYVHFINRTRAPLWFPAQEEPAFRPDEGSKILNIWFGYFDEVYGHHTRDYIIPKMRAVSPGENLTFEILSPNMVQKLVERRLSAQLYARIATRQLPESSIRGEQPLQEYLKHSCVIQSSAVVASHSQ